MFNTKPYYLYATVDGTIIKLAMLFAFDIEDAIMIGISSYPNINYSNIFALPYPNMEDVA